MLPGELASKANSRKAYTRGNSNKPIFVKSDKALAIEESAYYRLKKRDPLFTKHEDVILATRVYYASRRPDLDVSLLKDVLQGKAYDNDRSVKMEFSVWALDRDNPRMEIVVAPRDHWSEVVEFLMQFDGYPYEPRKRRRKKKK